MKDHNLITVYVGDVVKHRFRPQYPNGKVMKIEDGCNAVCWVDFGELLLDKQHLTICTSSDIIKQQNGKHKTRNRD